MFPANDLGGVTLHLFATRESAMWFLPFALPISAWVMWNDMVTMRIPNRTVYLLGACFLVVGLFALPFPDYLWRVVQMVIVFAIGLGLYSIGGVGAGDVKFAVAASGMIAAADAPLLLYILAATMLAALATHRLFRAVGPVKAATPHWKSWTSPRVPMGLGLGGCLIFYLLLVLKFGS